MGLSACVTLIGKQYRPGEEGQLSRSGQFWIASFEPDLTKKVWTRGEFNSGLEKNA